MFQRNEGNYENARNQRGNAWNQGRNDGNSENEVGNPGSKGGNDGMWRVRLRMMGMRGIRMEIR